MFKEIKEIIINITKTLNGKDNKAFEANQLWYNSIIRSNHSTVMKITHLDNVILTWTKSSYLTPNTVISKVAVPDMNIEVLIICERTSKVSLPVHNICVIT